MSEDFKSIEGSKIVKYRHLPGKYNTVDTGTGVYIIYRCLGNFWVRIRSYVPVLTLFSFSVKQFLSYTVRYGPYHVPVTYHIKIKMFVPPEMRIRSIFVRIRQIRMLKTGSRSCLYSPRIKSNIKFFYINQISSDIFM